MPRRVPDYPDAFEGWNYISSIGSIISVIATIIFLYIVYDILVYQPKSVSNVWAKPSFFIIDKNFSNTTKISNTLEWSLPSPTPYHAFQIVPVQS